MRCGVFKKRIPSGGGFEAVSGPDPTKANDLDVSHWITESFNLAKADVYKKPPIGVDSGPFTLTQTYKANAKDSGAKTNSACRSTAGKAA